MGDSDFFQNSLCAKKSMIFSLVLRADLSARIALTRRPRSGSVRRRDKNQRKKGDFSVQMEFRKKSRMFFNRTKRISALLVLIALHSCMSVPKKDIESSLQETPTLSNSLARASESPLFTPGDWPSEEWWEMFNDPQLAAYIRAALGGSPTLQQADAKVIMAREYAKQQRASILPNLNLDAGNLLTHLSKTGFFRAYAPPIPGTVDDTWVVLNLSYDLDFFGKNRFRYKAALNLLQAQQAESADVRLTLGAAVAKGYFELQADIERNSLLKKTAQRRRSLLHLHELRRAYGLDTQIDLLEADQDLLEIEKAISINEQSIELSDHVVRVLMGHTPDSANILEVLHIPFEEKVSLPSDLSLNLLSRRPDLMASIWQVESVANEIGAARADFYPDLNLFALAGFESVHIGKLFSWSNRAAGLIPALSLPIYTGGRLQANLREKWAEFHQATASYHSTLLNAAKEVVDQLTILLKLEDQLRIQQLTVENLRSHTELSLLRYAEGVSPYLEALETEEKLFDVEIQLIDLKLMQREALVNLIKGLGGGYNTTSPLTPSKGGETNG